jgi:hypothetical protein
LVVFVWLVSFCGFRCVVDEGGRGTVVLLLGGLGPTCIGFCPVSSKKIEHFLLNE